MNNSTFAWILIFIAGLNSTMGNLFLKKSREGSSQSFVESLFDIWFIGGVVFYGINVLMFVKALEYLPVSTAYPVLASTGFLFLAVSANIILGEELSRLQIAGICLVILGIIMLSHNPI